MCQVKDHLLDLSYSERYIMPQTERQQQQRHQLIHLMSEHLKRDHENL